ncbi:MAG: SDR family NAD(P)-dependent oxidoreductase, partial [Bacteroidota bacterium]
MSYINQLFDLSGQVALVTGGSHGIGMAIGKVLGKAGAKVVINGRSREKLESSRQEFTDEGVDVFMHAFDVTNEEEVDKGISFIEKEVGPIDILVNNAGRIKRVPILDMPVEE